MPAPQGALTSNSPCTLVGENDFCDVTIQLQKQDAPVGCLWALNPTRVVSCQGYESWSALWDLTYTSPTSFELRAYGSFPGHTNTDRLNGVLLDTLSIVAVRDQSNPNLTPQTLNYEYDALGRLISVVKEGDRTNYDYDAAGNRSSTSVD
ncbi:RHS repeat domain-containing protein [Gilvimarinus agarilyticus]|uniref:RHS repeat domain-containing protein n=1 Tax=Gilvimarinus agarilyticus TaxID=679259 RepID=UPI0018DB2691|nr:RHS repeat domain-containing protein [Gilvimarinus agarilyticus]